VHHPCKLSSSACLDFPGYAAFQYQPASTYFFSMRHIALADFERFDLRFVVRPFVVCEKQTEPPKEAAGSVYALRLWGLELRDGFLLPHMICNSVERMGIPFSCGVGMG
jgi:hypothetical protein